jgi:transposase
MEDVLNIYEKHLDPKEPVVCFDERPVQLTEESRPAHPSTAQPGKIAKQDYEYVRRGTANLFCIVEPKAGKHTVRVTANRKTKETAKTLKKIESSYPKAKTLHLIMDNLNTHSEKTLIKTYGDREGRRIWRRFTVHYTPKHGSWLNQAEIEISLISRQAMGKDRLGSRKDLRKRVTAWVRRANQKKLKIHWMFTAKKARKKFGYTPVDFTRSED